MTRKFNLTILISGEECNTTIVLDQAITSMLRLIDEGVQYKVKPRPWRNLKKLTGLMLLMLPWEGPPVSRAFSITWPTVKALLRGRREIGWVQLEA